MDGRDARGSRLGRLEVLSGPPPTPCSWPAPPSCVNGPPRQPAARADARPGRAAAPAGGLPPIALLTEREGGAAHARNAGPQAQGCRCRGRSTRPYGSEAWAYGTSGPAGITPLPRPDHKPDEVSLSEWQEYLNRLGRWIHAAVLSDAGRTSIWPVNGGGDPSACSR